MLKNKFLILNFFFQRELKAYSIFTISYNKLALGLNSYNLQPDGNICRVYRE